MIAKLIVYGRDREEALQRCRRALHEYLVEGVDTTVEFAAFLLNRQDVIDGRYNTRYVEKLLENDLASCRELGSGRTHQMHETP
jgi:acetyl-CoA carboxylase biotin carboxylase subunit